jgi:hypothetical protein
MSAPVLHEPMPVGLANAMYAVGGQLKAGLQTEAGATTLQAAT